jgi:hypothetical protein
MRKRIAYTAALAVAGAALVPAAAQAGNTNLTIVYNGSTTFYGQSKSHKASCENGRRVTLFLKQDGKDEKVGSDKTGPGKGDSEGVYVINAGIVVVGATYYAKVEPKGNCDGDKSKTVET